MPILYKEKLNHLVPDLAKGFTRNQLHCLLRWLLVLQRLGNWPLGTTIHQSVVLPRVCDS